MTHAATAARRLTEVRATFEAAKLEAAAASTAFEALVARQATGETVAEPVIAKAQAARDAAEDRLERATIGVRAAEDALEAADELDRQAAIAADWKVAEELGEKFSATAALMSERLVELDRLAGMLLDLGLELSVRSPRARARADAPEDFQPGPLRLRIARAVELSLPSLFPHATSTRFNFPGFEPRVCEPLSYFSKPDLEPNG